MQPQEFLKHAAFAAFWRLGLNRVLRGLRRRHLLIVLYHGVITAPRDPLGYCVHLSEFERQVRILARYFHPISLADLLAAIQGRTTLPRRSLLVTFDDGYRNNLTLAAPVLRRHGVPALFHVAAGYIGTTRILWVEEVRLRILCWPHGSVPMPAGQADAPLPAPPAERAAFASAVSEGCKNLADSEKQAYLDRLRETPVTFGEEYVEEAFAFLSWDEVRQLRDQGFDIGSHTIDHPILSALDPQVLKREVAGSKEIIETQLGAECACIGYPNGRRQDISDAVIEQARQAGYKAGFLLTDRFNRGLDSPLALTRVNILGYLPECVFHSRISGLMELRANWH